MTHYEFNALSLDDQALAVWNLAVQIAESDIAGYRLILYQLDAFYIEVWYHKKDNVIKKFRSFSNTDNLIPYINHTSFPLWVNFKFYL